MKKRVLASLFASAMIFAACSSEPSPSPVGGVGYVSFDCEASAELTRAEFTVPEVGDLSLKIEGEEYSKSWDKVSYFVSKENGLIIGDYTATVEWGNPAEEGLDKPAYAGSADFSIQAMTTSNVQIKAELINSQVRVVFTDAFKNYFHSESFVLKSSLGNEFAIDSTVGDTFFVAVGELSIEGTALKQNDVQIDFPAKTLQAEARTLHTLTYDMTTAGGAKVTITLDDTLIDELTVDTELNPES